MPLPWNCQGNIKESGGSERSPPGTDEGPGCSEEVYSISGVSYEIGKGNMLKGLDTALRGLKTDESATFTTELAGGEHAGEEAEVTVTATAVKQRELPKVDDEFAQLASEFDTVEEQIGRAHV